jgi:hypothetical protein
MEFWGLQKLKSRSHKSRKPKIAVKTAVRGGASGLAITELAEALGLDHGQVVRESKRPGFPSRVVKGKKLFDLEAVRAWRGKNIRMRKAPLVASGVAETKTTTGGPESWPPGTHVINSYDAVDSVSPATLFDQEKRAILATLKSAEASPLEVSRAAMRFAAARVADGETSKTLGFNDLDDLKKALQELRQSESDYIDLAKQKAELIPRDQVRAILGTCVTRLVQCMSVLQNSIASEFSTWLVDPAIQNMPADARSRKVREFVAKTCETVRRLDADGVNALIDKSIEEEN